MLERRREPRLSWNCTAPPSETIQHPPKSWGSGSVLRPDPWQEGGIQAPGACGPGLRGLGARASRAWGPAHQGPVPFPHKNHLSNYDFFANLLVGAWRRRGCRLKRLLRRWGPGGKRSRDTPPTPPPPPPTPPPSPPSATIQHAPQGRRNHTYSWVELGYKYPRTLSLKTSTIIIFGHNSIPWRP